jgi:polyhydroxyalkanoate synthesis repressor PhaR
VVIKKYANRRLYNTATSAYVTLDHLATMVKEKTDFVVYDAKTGDDITRSVLTQIIFEEESKGGQTLLPIPFLRQLISFYGDSLQGVVPQYLEMSMAQFARNQEQLRLQPVPAVRGDGQAKHGDVRAGHAHVQSVPAPGWTRDAARGGQRPGAARQDRRTRHAAAGQRHGDRRSQAQARRAAEPARGTQQEVLIDHG